MGLVGFVTDAVSFGGHPSSQIPLKAGSKVVLGVDISAFLPRVAIIDLTALLQVTG